jgi:cytochrome P450
MWDRFPPRMRKIITTALESAGRDRRDQASAEDLLVAMAQDPSCAAAFMLERCGIAPRTLLARLSAGQQDAPPGPALEKRWSERAGGFSSGAMHVLDIALAEADRRGDRHVGTEHLLLALSLTKNTPAAASLHEFKFTHDRALDALRAWHRLGMPRQRSALRKRAFTTPALRWLARPATWLGRYPLLAWNVYIRKSLGHPGFVSDPYPLYAKLRRTQPVRKDPLAPVWVITSYAETMTMLRDPRFKKDPFASERLPRIARQQLGVSDASAGRASAEMVSMLFLDPPEHTRVRSIFTKAFTPRRLESLRPRIEQITHKLLDRAESRARGGVIDLVADLAYPLPVTIIAELLGFPPEDYQRIKKWSDEMAGALALNPSTEAQTIAYRAREEIREYFNSIATNLKQSPGENLISALLTGEAYGERGERLSPDELFSNSILLLAAGHETTTGLIANGMLALLRNPDQLRDLRSNLDELIGPAVEELLRYDPPVQWTSRVAGEDLIIGGQPIERGQILLASVAAANRDPKVFTNPDRLDIRRKENRHLAFGTGIHFCLGAALARWEAQTAIAAILWRYPDLSLAHRSVRWRKGITFRGPESLLLRIK